MKTNLDSLSLDVLSATPALTENGSAIGGTNDGSMPAFAADFAAAGGSYVQAEATAVRTELNVHKAALREIATNVNALLAALK